MPALSIVRFISNCIPKLVIHIFGLLQQYFLNNGVIQTCFIKSSDFCGRNVCILKSIKEIMHYAYIQIKPFRKKSKAIQLLSLIGEIDWVRLTIKM